MTNILHTKYCIDTSIKYVLMVVLICSFQYAIKTIRKNRINSGADLTRIRREIEIMTRLGHPHIISVQEGRSKSKIKEVACGATK